MANELRHKDVGVKLTKAEYDAVTAHELKDGIEGDFIYWEHTSQCFKRIAHATDFNLHTKIVRKTADGDPVNNSTVLINDPELKLAIGANELWEIELIPITRSTAAASIKFAVAVPAGGAFQGLQWSTQFDGELTISPIIEDTEFSHAGYNANCIAGMCRGIVINGATPGNIQIKWAQYAAEASDTKVLKNSVLLAHKMA